MISVRDQVRIHLGFKPREALTPVLKDQLENGDLTGLGRYKLAKTVIIIVIIIII